MSGYKNFAVVGVGNVGAPIVDELLNAKSTGTVDKVVILSRPESATKFNPLLARGATVVPIVDYSLVPDVSQALIGIEVVISTVSHSALELQIPIAQAAKEAGVQLFVPSEFGMPTDAVTEGILLGKRQANEKARALGLPTALFFTGSFSDWLWQPSIDLDVKSGSVGVGGDGNAKDSFTSCPDIGRYLTYVLTMLPPAETKNRTFRIEGERTSFNEVFEAYEKKHRVKLQIKYTPLEELQVNVEKNPHDFKSALHLAWARGLGIVGSPLDNDLFPDWNPKPVIHYL